MQIEHCSACVLSASAHDELIALLAETLPPPSHNLGGGESLVPEVHGAKGTEETERHRSL